MVHPWLVFAERQKRVTAARRKLRTLENRQFEIPRLLRLSTLEELNQLDRFREFITPAWLELLTLEEPTYAETTLEFMASIDVVQFPVPDVNNPDAISYRLGGQWRRCSLGTFGVRLGLYTLGEVSTPGFAELLQDFSDTEAAAYWSTVATGRFSGRTSKATKFRDPLVRLMHRTLFHQVSGRAGSEGNVSKRDLFMIYSLVGRRPCNVAACVLESLRRNNKSSGKICGGAFVTRLARYHGLLADGVETTLMRVAEHEDLSLEQIRQMSLAITVHGVS